MKHHSMNLIFSLALLLGFLNTSFAKIQTSGAFITRWNLATAGSGATQLSFGSATIAAYNAICLTLMPIYPYTVLNLSSQ